jgi:glycosyltransferase involved in cell wall biosynthesis
VDIHSWDTTGENCAPGNDNWDRFSPFLLAVGRLHRLKGFDQLIEAFAQLQDTNLHLIILGEGAERNNLEVLVKQLGLEKRVLLPGWVSNPLSAYRSARCYVLSSRHESWSMVLVEAMASGCPVVSFACDYGPNEIINHGISGLLVEPGDVDGLSQAIRLVLGDEDLRSRLREGGRRRVEDFRLEVIAPEWLEETH